MKKLGIMKTIIDDGYDYIESKMDYVITKIENIFTELFKVISKNIYMMNQKGFNYSDFKYDNICFDIDENGEYIFYFIDPESTCRDGYSDIFKDGYKEIARQLEDRFSILKYNELKKNIFENFCSPMFNFVNFNSSINFDNYITPILFLFVEYHKNNITTKIITDCAQKLYVQRKEKIFPLIINSEEKFKEFVGLE
jgi:hypothetical protein